VTLRAKAVPPAKFGGRGGAAELGLLDTAALEADEVVMVAGLAADVGGTCVTGERPYGAGSTEELDCAVDRGEAELRLPPAGLLEEFDGGEAPFTIGNQIEDSASLGGEPEPGRQRKAAVVEPLLRLRPPARHA
jgi:hypothetical protein